MTLMTKDQIDALVRDLWTDPDESTPIFDDLCHGTLIGQRYMNALLYLNPPLTLGPPLVWPVNPS